MMHDRDTSFQVGDQVVHWIYGPGEIIQLDEKVLAGHTGKYYVVLVGDLTLWVPLNGASDRSLRFPTPAKDFQKLFHILSSPGESLSSDRYMRQIQLTEALRGGSLESICRVIRDLACFKRTNKINDSDNTILERARNLLLKEWSVALSVPIQQANRELRSLLETTVV